MEQALLELIELAKTAAPELWGIAMRQVYARIGVMVFFTVLAIVLAIVGASFVSKVYFQYKEKTEQYVKQEEEKLKYVLSDEDKYENELFVTSSIFVMCVIAVITLVSIIILNLINPQFYAIKILMGLAGISQ